MEAGDFVIIKDGLLKGSAGVLVDVNEELNEYDVRLTIEKGAYKLGDVVTFNRHELAPSPSLSL